MKQEDIIRNIGKFGLLTVNGNHFYRKQIHGWIKGISGDRLMFVCCENKKRLFNIENVVEFEEKKFKPQTDDNLH